MVSHLSWSQYPLIKKLGKDEVVIMTVKQGEDINNEFLKLRDSINLFKNKLQSIEMTNATLSKKTIYLLDSIKNRNAEFMETKSNLNWYQKEVSEYRKSYINLNKEYKVTIFGLTLSVAVFVAAISLFSNNY
jgi:chromosome segregation ATPase